MLSPSCPRLPIESQVFPPRGASFNTTDVVFSHVYLEDGDMPKFLGEERHYVGKRRFETMCTCKLLLRSVVRH